MRVLSEFRNELFKRNEVSYNLDSEKNPSFDEVRKKISEKEKKPEENIDVDNIKGSFGSHTFKIKAYIYDSKELKDKAVQKTQKQRKAEAEEAKKETTGSESVDSEKSDNAEEKDKPSSEQSSEKSDNAAKSQ